MDVNKPQMPPPPYQPPSSLSDNEIRKIYEENKYFLKTAIAINKPKLDAATENANNKTEQIIRDIIDPTPGLFVDDNFNSKNQNRNNNSDSVFTLPKKLNKRLDDILLYDINF